MNVAHTLTQRIHARIQHQTSDHKESSRTDEVGRWQDELRSAEHPAWWRYSRTQDRRDNIIPHCNSSMRARLISHTRSHLGQTERSTATEATRVLSRVFYFVVIPNATTSPQSGIRPTTFIILNHSVKGCWLNPKRARPQNVYVRAQNPIFMSVACSVVSTLRIRK